MSTLIRLSALETKLDQVLFRKKEDGTEEQPTNTVGAGAKIAGGVYGASVLKRGLSPLIADRRSGLRAAIPGFAQKSPLGQTVAATGSLLKEKPLAAMSGLGRTLGRDAVKVGKVAGMIGRESVGGFADSVRGVGMIARDVGKPLAARVKSLAGKLVRKA